MRSTLRTTHDRFIRQALGIGADQRFEKRCILDGELVLWDRGNRCVKEFHCLGEYLRGEGEYARLKTQSHHRNHDPQINLMAVFFDILLLDDRILLHEPYTTRTEVLSNILHLNPNTAITPRRFPLHLHPLESAVNSLRLAYSRAITQREEGFIFKPADAPYTGRHGWMKLKKDHIPGLGDTLDFCFVGAGFCAERARDGVKSQQGQKWNVCHVGCLLNKEDVIAKVCFCVLWLIAECSTSIRGHVYSDV